MIINNGILSACGLTSIPNIFSYLKQPLAKLCFLTILVFIGLVLLLFPFPFAKLESLKKLNILFIVLFCQWDYKIYKFFFFILNGLAKTFQLTASVQGGVVKDPS